MHPASSPIRILLAEDNDADAMIVEEALRSHSIEYEFVRVKDGRAALDLVSALEADPAMPVPHVIVLDLHLPKHDGLEIIRKIRSGPRCRELPIIALSASDSPAEINSVRQHSAIYFRKRSDFDSYMTLGAVVRDVVRDGSRKGPSYDE